MWHYLPHATVHRIRTYNPVRLPFYRTAEWITHILSIVQVVDSIISMVAPYS